MVGVHVWFTKAHKHQDSGHADFLGWWGFMCDLPRHTSTKTQGRQTSWGGGGSCVVQSFPPLFTLFLLIFTMDSHTLVWALELG